MKNKTITYTLAIIVLVLFTAYFGIKEIVRTHINLTESIAQVETYAKQDDWQKAYSLAKEVQKDWERYKLIININYAESEHSLFDEALNALVAGSDVKDLPTVLANAENAKRFWKNLNKIVPGP
ncbi:hypothetical protein GCM10028778_21670 [Barrientosiimonas marina]|uniref:DUF4363 family protein n=1 Tax=Lentibacillus kimchii TaxID=1542911 RepID=A0ABW2UWB1_9BACI